MKVLLFVLLFAAALTGCSPATQAGLTPTTVAVVATPAAETAVPALADPVQAVTAPAAPILAERPTWQTLPLVNARTGETFTFASFAGRTVFVEPMATWCTNCRQQLGNVRSAREQLSDEVVFVALSVETNISAADLAEYADDNGFDWYFAVLTPELLAELVTTFGRTVSNPPSTPHFVIRADGSATSLATGIKSAEQIVAQLQAEGGS